MQWSQVECITMNKVFVVDVVLLYIDNIDLSLNYFCVFPSFSHLFSFKFFFFVLSFFFYFITSLEEKKTKDIVVNFEKLQLQFHVIPFLSLCKQLMAAVWEYMNTFSSIFTFLSFFFSLTKISFRVNECVWMYAIIFSLVNI